MNKTLFDHSTVFLHFTSHEYIDSEYDQIRESMLNEELLHAP